MFGKDKFGATSQGAIESLEQRSDNVWQLPETFLVFDAEFSREGHDLILEEPFGQTLRLENYFAAETPQDLLTHDGAMLSAKVVERLAGPLFPGQYAQSDGVSLTEAIGQVETVSGTAFAQRTDGTVVQLEIGTKVFQGDVVRTEFGSTLGLTFLDGTIFTLAAGSRMVLDELIYDPESAENKGVFNLVQGGFVFIAGEVAGTGGIEINTPATTLGIRGTTGLIDIQSLNGILTVIVSLNLDPDGGLGEIELRDLSGELISTITSTDTKWIIRPPFTNEPPIEVERTQAELNDDAVLLNQAAAVFQSAITRVQNGENYVEFEAVNGEAIDALPTEDPGEPPAEPAPAPTAPPDEPETLDDGESGDDTQELDGDDEVVPEGDTPPSTNDDAQLEPPPTSTDTAENTGNRAPEIASAPIPTVEDTPFTGTVPVTDREGDAVEVTLVQGAENGLVVLSRDGTFTYTPDENFEGTDSFLVRAEDTEGGVTESEVTIAVDPVNDAPVVNVALTETTAREAGVSAGPEGGIATGQIAYADVDEGDTPGTWTIAASDENTTAFGQASIDPQSGTWTYELDQAAADILGQDETTTESFVATVTDADGATDTSVVVVTVTGTNDGPVITSALDQASGALSEAMTGFDTTSGSGPGDAPTGAGSVSGTLSFQDADQGDTPQWSVSTNPGNATALGSIAIDPASGVWTYTLNEAAADVLGNGDVATEMFTAQVTDGFGAAATQEITVTVTGLNDAPTIEFSIEDISATVFEDGFAAGDGGGLPAAFPAMEAADADASGTLRYVDPDGQVGDTATWSVSPDGASLGEMTIDAETGEWHYFLDEDLAQGLREGEEVIETFTAMVTDGLGAASTQTITITIIGSNDASEIVVSADDLEGAVEDGGQSTATGTLSYVDPEALPGEESTWSISPNGPSLGSMSIDELTGVWLYTLDQGLADVLAQGEVRQELFTATLTDPFGATSSQIITITLTGENDAPIISDVATSGAVKEAGASDPGTPSATGTLIALDPDQGTTASFWSIQPDPANATALGTMQINAQTGTWLYTLDQNAAQSLEAGDTVIERFQATITDAFGATDTAIVEIQVEGTNDAPVLTAGATAATEGGPAITFDLGALATDPDANQDASHMTFALAGSLSEGSAQINGSTLTFDPGSDFQDLAAGDTRTVDVDFTATDADGASTAGTVEITVTGTNSAPTFAANAAGTIDEDDASVSLNLASFGDDPDNGEDGGDLAYALIGSPSAGSARIVGNTLVFEPGGDFSELTSGQSVQVNIPIRATDPGGLSTTGSVEITVTGTNAAPTLSGGTFFVDADGPAETIDLADFGDDPDVGEDGTTLSYQIISGPSSGSAAISGTILSFTPDSSFADLGQGETRTVSIGVRAADAEGLTDTATFFVTVTGNNEGPVITSGAVDAEGDVIEAGATTAGVPTASGTLSYLDVDESAPNEASWSISPTNTPLGAMSIGASSGIWVYTLDNAAADGLNEGETRVETFTATVMDAAGATATQIVTVTITGSNDAPLLATSNSEIDADGGSIEIPLAPLAEDVDSGDTDATLTFSIARPPSEGSLTLANGVLEFFVGSDFDDLPNGETQTVTFDITATDTTGASVTTEMSVEVTGTQTAPEITSGEDDAQGNVTEAGTNPGPAPITTGGTLTYIDPDAQTPTSGIWTIGGTATLGSIEIDPASGVWLYTLDNALSDGLDQGDEVTEEFVATITDADGLTDTQAVTVTVLGTNDAPSLTSATTPINEDQPDVSVDLRALASDPDASDTPATLTFRVDSGPADGNVSITGGTLQFFTAGDFEDLAAGEVRSVFADIEVRDAAGATGITTFQFDVTGTNDAPIVDVANSTFAGVVQEAGVGFAGNGAAADASGTMLYTDVDEQGGALGTWSATPIGLTLGNLTINPSSGAWQYFLDEGAADSLREGEVVQDQFTAVITDAEGATDSQIITISITGTNDAPVIDVPNSVTEAGYEDGNPATLTGQLVADDPDNVVAGPVWSIVVDPVDGGDNFGSMSINPVTGLWTYVANTAAVAALAEGEIEYDHYDATITDEFGETSTVDVTISLTGTNAAPTIFAAMAETDLEVTEAGAAGAGIPTASGQLSFSDPDGGATVGNWTITPSGATTYGNVSIGATTGLWTFTIDQANADMLNDGQVVTETFQAQYFDIFNEGSNLLDLQVEITGDNDAPTMTAATGAVDADGGFALQLGPLSNDVDMEHDPADLTFALNGAVADGLANVTPEGIFTYNPNGDFDDLAAGETEQVVVGITVSDPLLASTNSTVTITVTGVNEAPEIILPDYRPDDLDIVWARSTNAGNPVSLNDGSANFSDGSSLALFSRSIDVELGDLDDDGDLDIIAPRGSSMVDILLNDGQGNFTSNGQVNFAVGSNMGSDIGDLDGDGDHDAIVVRQSGTPDAVIINDGSGVFTLSAQTIGSGTTNDVALGDIDGDGDLDAVRAHYGGFNTLSFNDGSGIFTDSAQQLGNSNSQAVALGDVDGDGDLDAVFANGNAVSNEGNEVFLNDGNGNFSDSGQSLGTFFSTDVALGDLDGDGDLDAAFSNSGASGLGNTVYLNDGNGVFTLSAANIGAFESQAIEIADLDADGDLDVIVANALGQDNLVYLNDGAGAFTDSGVAIPSNGSRDLTIGDIDGDSTPIIGNRLNESLDTGVNTNSHTASGSVDFVDIDSSGSFSATVTGVSASGKTGGLPAAPALQAMLSASITDPGSSTPGTLDWTFSATGAAFDYLANQERVTLAYDVEVSDGDGGTTPTVVEIKIIGTNDAPEFSGPGTFALQMVQTMAGSTTLTGGFDTILFDDVDIADTGHTTTITGVTTTGVTTGLVDNATLESFLSLTTVKPGTSASGQLQWTFQAQEQVFDYLAQGESVTITYGLEVDDGDGGTDNTTLALTVTGANTLPVINAADSDIAGSMDTYDPRTAITTPVNDTPTLVRGTHFFGNVFGAPHPQENVAGIAFDPVTGKVYESVGVENYGESAVQVYASLADFEAGTVSTQINLGTATNGSQTDIYGTYFTAYNDVLIGKSGGSAFQGPTEIAFWDATNGAVLNEISPIPGVITIGTPNYGFAWGGFTSINLFQDSTGIYALGKTDATNWTLATIDPTTQSVTGTQTIAAGIQGFAFIVEGNVFFGNYNTGQVTRAYNIETSTISNVNISLGVLGGSNDYWSNASYDIATDTLYLVNSPNSLPNGAIYKVENVSQLVLTPSTQPSGTLVFDEFDLTDTIHTVSVAFPDAGGYLGTIDLGDPENFSGTEFGVEWQYRISKEDFDGLTAGQIITENFDVTVTDGFGGTDTQRITITVEGVNDAAVITGDTGGTVVENDLVNMPTGDLDYTDVDGPDDQWMAETNAAATFGTYSIDASGNWSYTLDNNDPLIDVLDPGDTATDSFTVETTDGTQQIVTINIQGFDDPPVITGTTASGIVEDAALNFVTGNLDFTDVDGDDPNDLWQEITAASNTASDNGFGTVEITTDGVWTYTLDNANATVNALGQGDPALPDTFTVLTADGTAQQVTINIAGANDAPVTTPDTFTATEDDNALIGNILSNDSDPEGDQFFRGSISSPNPALDGSWGISTTAAGDLTFVGGTQFQHLSAGDTAQATVLYDAVDEHGARSPDTLITINVTGLDDAAVITGTTAAGVVEDSATNFATGDLDHTDVDSDDPDDLWQEITVASNTASDNGYGTVSITTAGVWTYTLDNANGTVNALQQGDPALVDTFTVLTSDGTSRQVTINIAGANDAPVAADETASFTLDLGMDVSGPEWREFGDHFYQFIPANLPATDFGWAEARADAIARGGHLANVTSAAENAFLQTLNGGAWGWLGGSDQAVEGEWRWMDGPEAGQQFWQGDFSGSAVGGFYANWEPGQPNVPAEDYLFAIGTGQWHDLEDTGAAPETLGYFLEYSGLQATGSVATNTTDAENDALTYALTAPVDGLTMFQDGSWTFDLISSAYDALAAGATTNVAAGYQVTDTQGATGTGTLTLTITGIDNPAVVTGDITGNVAENAIGAATGDLDHTDPDSNQADDVWQVVSTQTASDNGYGLYTIAVDGQWVFLVDNANATVDALGDSDTLIETFTVQTEDGTEQEVTVTIQGSNDAPIAADQTLNFTADAGMDVSGPEWSEFNGHYYQFIPANVPATDFGWAEARADAISRGGHLANVTSAAENAFIHTLNSGAVGWLGGSDQAVEGEWRWVDGPEQGLQFWQGGLGGNTVGGLFASWAGGQPAGFNEDYLHSFGGGGWNDIQDTGAGNQIMGYFLEYSGPQGTGSAATGTTDAEGDGITYALTTALDGLTMYADGSLFLNLNDDGFVPLGASQTQAYMVDYTATDEHGASDTGTLTINVTGINDAAVVSGATSGTIAEDGSPFFVTGDLDHTDVDGDNADDVWQAEAAAGNLTDMGYGTHEIDASGNWTFYLNNANATVNALNAGENLFDSFTVATQDGTTQVVNITIQGNDDAPVVLGEAAVINLGESIDPGAGWSQFENHYYRYDATPTTWAAARTAATTDGGYLVHINSEAENTFVQGLKGATNAWTGGSDQLVDGTWLWTDGPDDGLQFWSGGGGPFSFAFDGAYTNWTPLNLNPNDAGGNEDHMVIQSDGTWNDLNNATAGIGSVAEYYAPRNFTGDVSTNDSDPEGLGLMFSLVNPFAGLSMNTDGTWTFDQTSTTAYDYLGASSSENFNVAYDVEDAGGNFSSGTLVLTINGENNAAAGFTGTTSGSVDDATLGDTATGNVNFTDVDDDNADDVWQVMAPGAVSDKGYGTYGVTADGQWTYLIDNNNATVDALQQGQSYNDQFTILTEDGTRQQIVITVNGTNDAAIISGDTTGSVTEDGVGNVTSGNLDHTDVDNTDDVWVGGGLVIGQYGNWFVNTAGQWSYTLNNANMDVDDLNDGETLTETLMTPTEDGTLATITVTIHGTTDAVPLVANDDSGFIETIDVLILAPTNALSSATANQLNGANGNFFNFNAVVQDSGAALTAGQWDALFANYDVVLAGPNGWNEIGGITGEISWERLANFHENNGGNVVTTGSFIPALDPGANGPSATRDALDILSPIGLNPGQSSGGSVSANATIHPITDDFTSFTYGDTGWQFTNVVDLDAFGLAFPTGNGGSGVHSIFATNEAGNIGRSVFLGGNFLDATAGTGASLRSNEPDQLLEQAIAWAAGVNKVDVDENTPFVFTRESLLANDDNAETATITGVSAISTKGASVFLSGGDVVYNPLPSSQLDQSLNDGDTTTDTFTYTIEDGGQSSTGTVTVTVNGITDIDSPPVLVSPDMNGFGSGITTRYTFGQFRFEDDDVVPQPAVEYTVRPLSGDANPLPTGLDFDPINVQINTNPSATVSYREDLKLSAFEVDGQSDFVIFGYSVDSSGNIRFAFTRYDAVDGGPVLEMGLDSAEPLGEDLSGDGSLIDLSGVDAFAPTVLERLAVLDLRNGQENNLTLDRDDLLALIDGNGVDDVESFVFQVDPYELGNIAFLDDDATGGTAGWDAVATANPDEYNLVDTTSGIAGSPGDFGRIGDIFATIHIDDGV